jgi:hypothetical protein
LNHFTKSVIFAAEWGQSSNRAYLGETKWLEGEKEMFVVSRGVEHKPVAESECKILLVEPVGTVNTGDAGGALTAENNVWI